MLSDLELLDPDLKSKPESEFSTLTWSRKPANWMLKSRLIGELMFAGQGDHRVAQGALFPIDQKRATFSQF